MSEPILLEGKGITLEVWTTAKGEKQWRIKVSQPLNDIENNKFTNDEIKEQLDKLIVGCQQILKERFDIEVK